MAVDSLAYGFNLYAEREKNKDKDDIQDQSSEDGIGMIDNIELSGLDERNTTTYCDDCKGEGERKTTRTAISQTKAAFTSRASSSVDECHHSNYSYDHCPPQFNTKAYT